MHPTQPSGPFQTPDPAQCAKQSALTAASSPRSRDKVAVLLFGGLFLFVLIRALAVVDIGAWFLLLLPTVGYPVYFYGRVLYLFIKNEPSDYPSMNDEKAVAAYIARGKREEQITLAFLIGPLVISVALLIYYKLTPK
jgi:hypothetical protein